MKRQQAKELLPIISAFAEGKTIQYYCKSENPHWIDIEPNEVNQNVDFSNDPSNYRIKSEPKYRPFANIKECWEEIQKHKPLGWIKSNVDNNLYSILAITSHGCLLTDRNIISFPHLCKYNTFADGTPVGIKYE